MCDAYHTGRQEDFLWKIDYNPETGVMRANGRVGVYAKGDVIEPSSGGLTVAGKKYRMGKLAWRLLHGAWPAGQVVLSVPSLGYRASNMADLGSKGGMDHPAEMTQAHLRSILRYCPATGIFAWSQSISTRAKVGGVAGTDNGNGYIKIRIGGVQYYAHRLAMLYIYGWMPENVDHKDGCRENNALENLRPATSAENMQNRYRSDRNSTTGLLGTSLTESGRFDARIEVEGRMTYLGRFDTAEEAHAAYVDKKRELHPFGML